MSEMSCDEREQMLCDFRNTLVWAKNQLNRVGEPELAAATQKLIESFEERMSLADNVVHLDVFRTPGD